VLLTRTTRQGPARQSPPTSSRPGSAVSSVRTIALVRDSDRHGDDAQASASPSAASSKGGAAQLANDDDDGAFSSELPLAATREVLDNWQPLNIGKWMRAELGWPPGLD